MTLSPPVRVFALVGALVLTGVAAFVFLLGGGPLAGETATPASPATKPANKVAVKTPAVPKARAKQKPAATRKAPRVAGDLPAAVQAALRNRRIAVVAVYVPGAQVDSLVRREARAGAAMSKAAFVRISASNEVALQKLVAKTGVLPAPAVVILKRPGVVAATLGVADRQTVAAAVAQAKSRR